MQPHLSFGLLHLLSSAVCSFLFFPPPNEVRKTICCRLIHCYQIELYECIKVIVSAKPRDNAHKTENNCVIIVTINPHKSTITCLYGKC